MVVDTLENTIELLKQMIPGLNCVETYQVPPKSVTFPTVAVSYDGPPEIVTFSGQPINYYSTSDNQTIAYGQENAAITLEIIHNNKYACRSLARTIINIFQKIPPVIFNGTTYILRNYTPVDTSEETVASHWFFAIRLNAVTALTYEQAVYRIKTIDLRLQVTLGEDEDDNLLQQNEHDIS